MNVTEIVGLVAGTLTMFSFIPQVLKVWREKSATGVSLSMYIIFCVGVLLWTVYGLMLGELPIILANGATLILACSILVMKVKWG